jgi:hypothetical protein
MLGRKRFFNSRLTEDDMAKTKINVKQVLADIRSGASDGLLMEKYGLSDKGLDSLFKKLTEANLLSREELSQRRSAASDSADPSPKKSSPPSPEPKAEAEVDRRLVEAASDLLRQGRHDNEIMRELNLSPGDLKKLKEDMVRLGYIQPLATEPVSPRDRGTKSCPSCGREMAEEESYCRFCGHGAMPPSPQMNGSSRDHGIREMPLEEDSDEKYCEWEDSRNEGTLRAFFQTASRCLLTPSQFFSSLPLESGYWSPLLFCVMAGVFGGVLGALWYHLLKGGSGAFAIFQILIIMSLGFIGSLIVMPLFLIVMSGIVHGILLLVGGANNGFQATFRVISYSSVTSLFKAIPVVGTVASLWGTYLAIVGVRETHETSTGKAAGAVLVPVVVPIVVSTLLLGMWWLPWGKGSKPVKMHSQMPAAYTGQPLPSDVCRSIDDFLASMDSLKSTDFQEAGPRIKAAMKELQESLDNFKDDERMKRVTTIAGSIAGLNVAIALMRKAGKGDVNQAEKQVEEFKASLKSMCPE